MIGKGNSLIRIKTNCSDLENFYEIIVIFSIKNGIFTEKSTPYHIFELDCGKKTEKNSVFGSVKEEVLIRVGQKNTARLLTKSKGSQEILDP